MNINKKKVNIENKWNFSHFKTQEMLADALHITVERADLTPGEKTELFTSVSFLQEILARGRRGASLNTEKAVSEAYIFPVLTEIALFFIDKITLFSGERCAVSDANAPLNGVCDFIFGGKPRMNAPKAPLICVVEAKKQDFDIGTYQCAAELYACKLNNEREGLPYPFYFGCVTSGDGWRFIKLDCEKRLLIRDTFTYSLNNLPQLLGVWKWVIDTQLDAAPQKENISSF